MAGNSAKFWGKSYKLISLMKWVKLIMTEHTLAPGKPAAP